ncbi:MAG: hypothetical protein ACTSXA_04555 [Candidatus Heimdallarchaeota archaeon]
MSLIRINDEIFFDFYLTECPRDRTLFKDCMFSDWKEIIEEFSQFKNSNKFITGRAGNRKLDLIFLNDILIKVNNQIVERLLETEKGMDFLQLKKHVPQKMLTFCCIGCQIPIHDYRSKKLSQNKARIMCEAIYNCFLKNSNVSNSDLQDFEQQISKREKKKEYSKRSQKQDTGLNLFSMLEEDTLDHSKTAIELEFKLDNEIKSTIESPLLLSRDKLRKLSFFDIENYFLEGDEELTDALRKVCTNEEVKNKRCITCDETHEFYSLASRKLIHLFIYKNELFDSINLTSDCLLEERIDVTELRRRLELLLRQEVGKWELTQEEKNKFVLCTVCHLIRHFRLLGQLDQLDGIQSLFKFKGEIFNLSEVEMQSDRTQVMNELQLDAPQVIGEAQPDDVVVTQLPRQEKITGFKGLNDTKLAELKTQLEMIAKRLDMASLTPNEIIEYKRKAKKLLNTKEVEETFEPDYSWIDVFLANSHDKEIQPFLAKEALIRLEKEMNKEVNDNLEVTNEIIPNKDLTAYHTKCLECTKTIKITDCLDKTAIVDKAIKKGKIAISKLWYDREDLRPCIANEILRK